MTVAGLLAWGGPAAVAVCVIAASARYRRALPPRTPQEARRREVFAVIMPYSQLGVRVDLAGFAYSNGPGRCLGPVAGAEAKIVGAVRVASTRPQVAWAVIYFADGSIWRQPVATRNLPEARQQAERFNGQAKTAPAPGVFRRSWTPAHTP